MSYYEDDNRSTINKVIDYGMGVIFGFSILILCTAVLAKQNFKSQS